MIEIVIKYKLTMKKNTIIITLTLIARLIKILSKMSHYKRGLINRRYNNGINYLNGSISLLPINYLFMYGQNQNN